MFSFLVLLALLYVAFVALLYVAQRSFMYHPSSERPQIETLQLTNAQEIFDHAASDRLIGWYLPPKAGHPMVLYFHGNAGTVEGRGYKMRAFAEQGWGVFLVEYSGFGGNPGKPSEAALYEDAERALHVLNARGYAAENLILYGESLGSAIATELALRLTQRGTPVRGLILEAPFSTMGHAAESHYPIVPARYLVKDKYLTLEKIHQVQVPLYVMHGGRDRTVPQSHGKRVFARALEPKEAAWIDQAGHVDVFELGGFAGLMAAAPTLFPAQND